jgi:hypothetical protein
MKLCTSFSVVNFIVGCCSLNSANALSMFFSFGHRLKEYHPHISSIRLLGVLLILGVFVFHVLDICFS